MNNTHKNVMAIALLGFAFFAQTELSAGTRNNQTKPPEVSSARSPLQGSSSSLGSASQGSSQGTGSSQPTTEGSHGSTQGSSPSMVDDDEDPAREDSGNDSSAEDA